MKRKKSGGGGANWMDTYGDMVTLLLCFFVLLYSMSTISEENWKALVMTFNPDAARTPSASPGGEGPSADGDMAGVMPTDDEEGEVTQEQIDQDIQDLYQALKAYAEQEGMQNTLSVTKGNGKVFLSFNQTAFFDGDSWQLRQDSLPVLDTVSGMLTDAVRAIDEVRVVGHTAQRVPDRENDPLTDRMLSSQRAANVVTYVQTHSELDPARLVSEGIGQWRPVADNDTPEGRAQNRRVEMIVSGRNLEQELESAIQQYST